MSTTSLDLLKTPRVELRPMRERSYKVDTSKLVGLSAVYGSLEIANRLSISKQLWYMYKKGNCDIPESKIERICAEFKLSKSDLVLAP